MSSYLFNWMVAYFFVFLVPWWVMAQTNLSGLVINADNYEYNSKKKIAYLKGNVQVVFDGNHLVADQATVSIESKTIKAEGKVVLQNPQVYIGANRVDFQYEKKIGFFYDAFVHSGQAVFEGKVIEKIGENDYVAHDAYYSTCETCPPAWSFSGRKITAKMGGYAWITRPVLRIANFPVFILPGIVVPLKSERQSGFLVPSYNYSTDGGHAFSQSYFWAISQNKDLTLTARNYEKRGFKTLGEYRYVLSPTDKGTFTGAHIKDRAFSGRDDVDKVIDRWFVNYSHRFELPNDYVQRMNLSSVSDLRYPVDFPREIDANGDPSLENQVSLSKTTESQQASVEATVNINLLKTNPLASNEDSIHRLPEIHYNLTSTRILNTDLLGKMHFNYTNFQRSGLAYDDMETLTDGDGTPYLMVTKDRDGSFDPANGDLLRAGQRLDLEPSLSYPILVGESFEIVPEIVYRETQYRFQLDEDGRLDRYGNASARRYIKTEISAGSQFSRVFGKIEDNRSGQKFKHEFEPKISFVTIPWLEDPEHDFFGDYRGQSFSRSEEPISDDDLNGENGVQFDYNDRVFDTRLVNFSLSNKIVRKRWAGDDPDYRSLLIAKLDQSYDLNEASQEKVEKPQPWQPINGLLDVRFDQFDSYTKAIHYPYAQVTNLSSRVRSTNTSGGYAELFYSRFVRVNEDNSIESSTKTENVGMGLGFASRYINLSGSADYSTVTFDITSWRYTAVIKPPGDCWGFFFTGIHPLNGRPEFDFNLSFNFAGN
jgi:LPS-assembly protein